MPPPPRRSSRQYTATGATTASITNKKQQQLPSWAKLSRPQRRADDPLTLAEEEAYMRTKTYFESARLIDLTVNETLQQLLETTNILQEIKDMTLRHVNDASGANEGEDEQMNNEHQELSSLLQPINNQESISTSSEDDDFWSRYKLAQESSKPQSRFDPLLLPVLTLDGPTHSLDRYEWMRVLVQACKQQLLQTSVVWLQSFATVSSHSNTHNVPLSRLTEELTRQCLWQEHERNQDQNLPPTLTQAQLRSCGNCSELLQQWARQTVHFHHGILVLVDAANATTSLLEWASEQRSLHGIPISIVLLSHSSDTMLSSGSNLLYYLQTHSDCLVQRKSLPSSQNVLQQVWQALYVKHAFAYHLGDQPVLSAVTSAFNDKHGSFVHALMQVKATLADFFASYRGSALMVATTANTAPYSSKPTTTTDMAKRRKWFMLDANAKRYSFPQMAAAVHAKASGSGRKRKRKQDEVANGDGINHNNCDPIACLQELEQHRRQVAIIMQLETCFLQHWRPNVAEKQQQPLHLNTQSLLHAMESSSAFSTEQVSKDAVRDMMALLFRLQQDELDRQAAMIADESINSSLSIPLSKTPNHNSIRAFIHRLVIVLDQASFVSDILYVFDSVHQAWHASLERTLMRRSSRQFSSLLQQPIVRPRRDTVLGLVHPAEINIPGLLYRLLNTCCSVTLNDWFAMFVTHQRRELSTLDDNDTQQQLLMFATGVYSLQVQGLIKGERKTSSGKSVFDKSVLVWCGVDE